MAPSAGLARHYCVAPAQPLAPDEEDECQLLEDAAFLYPGGGGGGSGPAAQGRSRRLALRDRVLRLGPRTSLALVVAIAGACGLAAALGFPAAAWRAHREGPPAAAEAQEEEAQGFLGLAEDAKTAAVANKTCSGPGASCKDTKCCTQKHTQCFEKNEFFAGCMVTCSPGVHRGDPDKKPWSCKRLTEGAPPPPAPGACVASGEDCSVSKCCQDPALSCFEKNQWFATCMVKCEAGVHKGDKDGKPWSCNLLQKPGVAAAVANAVLGPAIACDAGPLPNLPAYAAHAGKPAQVKMLTYNLFWWNLYGVRHGNGDSASHLIQAMSHPVPFDVMGFQECEDGNRVLAAGGLAGQYQAFMFSPMSKTTALCMAFRTASFSLISQGQAWVAEDEASQYFGKRAMQWMRLHHRESGRTLFFANHHGPLRVGSGGKCGGGVTGLKLLTAISQGAKPGDAIVLLGDFNAGPGSATLNQVGAKLKDFYPAGIDNVFTNLPPEALVGKADIGSGGSDHDALMVQVVLGGGGQWPHPAAPPPGKPPPPPPAAPPPKPPPPGKPAPPPGKPAAPPPGAEAPAKPGLPPPPAAAAAPAGPPPQPAPTKPPPAAPAIPPAAPPPPPAAPAAAALWFDCNVGVPKGWSDTKRTWCCTKKGVACAAVQAGPAPAAAAAAAAAGAPPAAAAAQPAAAPPAFAYDAAGAFGGGGGGVAAAALPPAGPVVYTYRRAA